MQLDLSGFLCWFLLVLLIRQVELHRLLLVGLVQSLIVQFLEGLSQVFLRLVAEGDLGYFFAADDFLCQPVVFLPLPQSVNNFVCRANENAGQLELAGLSEYFLL